MLAAPGATGPTGPAGAGAIIPFSSGGTPSILTTVLGGLLNTSSILGFGDSTSGLSAVGGLIDLTGSDNFAFSVPRDGIITSMSAFFSTTIGASLIGSTVTVSAHLFQSTTPDNDFTEVPGAVVTLTPVYNGLVTIGQISSGVTTGLAVPVTAGTRLMVVFSSDVTAGLDIASNLTGNTSAGLAIS